MSELDSSHGGITLVTFVAGGEAGIPARDGCDMPGLNRRPAATADKIEPAGVSELLIILDTAAISQLPFRGGSQSMGKRREPRKPIQVPVRILGTDSEGKIFSETVTTTDVSQKGAQLGGVRARIKVDELIGATYGKNKVHFRVKWTGEPGSPREGQMGVLNVTPEKPFWDFPVPSGDIDNYRFAEKDRRQSGRVKCSISAELHPVGQSLMRGNLADLSLGGCFVELSSPLPVQTKFEIGLWLGEIKLRLTGQVVSASPGFGIGVRFVNLSSENQELLRRHLQTLAKTNRPGLR